MLLLRVGIAQAAAFGLHWAPPAPSKRHTRRSTTNPLLTTRRFAPRRVGSATAATRLASNRFGCQAVVGPGRSLCVGRGLSGRARARGTLAPRALSAPRRSLATRYPPPPWPGAMGAGESAQRMRQLATVTRRRHQWQANATQRGEPQRDQRTQRARLRAERAQATPALQEAPARRRPLESHGPAIAVRLTSEVVGLSLPLFFQARLSCRAVCRVLRLLASALGLTRAPGPPTVSNGVSRRSIGRLECARGRRGVPLARAPCTNGRIGRIALSLGLGPGKRGAVVALAAQHPPLGTGAPSLAHGHGIGVAVAASWTGATMAGVLRPRSAPRGRPAAALKDGGSERHKAVAGLAARGLARPCLDDSAHAAARMRQRSDQPHPPFARFLSACGRGSGPRTHTRLACVAPPTVRTTARLMPVPRVCPWAAPRLQRSPAGGAKAGASLARLRAGREARPAGQARIQRFRGDAQGLRACQQMRKTQGRCHATLAPCAPLRATMPTAAVRQECRASLAVQLAPATTLGLDHVGLPRSAETIASLFGVATPHGVGQTQEAARSALRFPAFGGAPTREDAAQVLAVRVARQHAGPAPCPSLPPQRRAVLGHPEHLEGLGRAQGPPHVARLPGPKKGANGQETLTISTRCDNPYGPRLADLDDAFLIGNAAPPGMRETAWAW